MNTFSRIAIAIVVIALGSTATGQENDTDANNPLATMVAFNIQNYYYAELYGTDDAIGSDVWQAGAAAVYFNAASPIVQWGGLLTCQTDFAGSGDSTSLAVLQPFLMI